MARVRVGVSPAWLHDCGPAGCLGGQVGCSKLWRLPSGGCQVPCWNDAIAAESCCYSQIVADVAHHHSRANWTSIRFLQISSIQAIESGSCPWHSKSRPNDWAAGSIARNTGTGLSDSHGDSSLFESACTIPVRSESVWRSSNDSSSCKSQMCCF